jgi:tetraacyldisaccharide 4'-kinase
MGLLGMLYYIGYRAKRAMDLSRQRRLPVPVISLGNLTVGGTGKTPATVALALEASKRGFRPAVLTRGYKGRLKGPCIVESHMDPRDVGDEPLLMSQKLGGIPVIKGANRYESGMYALETLNPKPDLFILDDGYQHLKLYRDVDVLLVSALNPFDNMRLLPVGVLREPLSQIGRAHMIVVTKCNAQRNAELEELVHNYNASAPIFYADHKPSVISTFEGETHPLSWIEGKTVHGFCGIAEPESFEKVLQEAGAEVKGLTPYRDHHVFTEEDIADIERLAERGEARWIITTEKDIMRLRGMKLPENVLTLGIEFDVETAFYDQVLAWEETGRTP